LDEPTAAISVRQVAEVLSLIRELRDRGLAIVLVPNFTEERVKRFARILESNESLIDDLWQLAV
jgi:ABC-type sugar transport system ATPase subunit